MPGSIDYVREMVQALKPLEVNLVLKLHATSFYPAMAGGQQWRAVLDALARDPAVHIDEEEDDLEALRYADVLVNDYSSRAFIFMAEHKPVVLVTPSSPNMQQENLDRMNLMRSGSRLAHSPSEAAQLVSRLLRDPTPPPDADKIAERCFSEPMERHRAGGGVSQGRIVAAFQAGELTLGRGPRQSWRITIAWGTAERL